MSDENVVEKARIEFNRLVLEKAGIERAISFDDCVSLLIKASESNGVRLSELWERIEEIVARQGLPLK